VTVSVAVHDLIHQAAARTTAAGYDVGY